VVPAAGFSELLRLGLDAATVVEGTGGDPLPDGGNGLPLSELATELVPATPTPGLSAEVDVDAALPPAIDLPPPEVELAPAEPGIGLHATPLAHPDAVAAAVSSSAPATATVAEAADDVLAANAKRPAAPVTTPALPLPQVESDAPEVASPVVRPMIDPPIYRQRRVNTRSPLEQPVSGARPAATELVTPATAAADRALQPVAGIARDDVVVKPSNLQQVMQQLAQPAAHQPTPQAGTQPFSVEPPSGSLPAQSSLVQTPVGDSAWGERIGERVLVMAGSQIKSAEIRLTPAELGPLRVQVTVDDGAANVTFHAQHAVTREAIEQAMPRLREMLAESGLNLAQTSVSEQGVANQGGTGRQGAETAGTVAGGSDEADVAVADDHLSAESAARVSDSLVDTFV
jgi:flagellar hook-length control protein FliK